MKKIILREFINGTGICSPDGWVYKDCLMPMERWQIDHLLLMGLKHLKWIIPTFYAKNWIQNN